LKIVSAVSFLPQGGKTPVATSVDGKPTIHLSKIDSIDGQKQNARTRKSPGFLLPVGRYPRALCPHSQACHVVSSGTVDSEDHSRGQRIDGYYNWLEALHKPGSEMHREARMVLGKDFDPARFDLKEVNWRLSMAFKPAPKKPRKGRNKRD
jgi:hypothetical protein